MDGIPIFSNAIVWAHRSIKGGWRSWGLMTGGYTLLLLGGFYLSWRAKLNDYNDWLMTLVTLQVVMLFLYAPWAVLSTIRKDMSTGMIYSHRLMPISGTQAILGYLIAAVIQPVTFFAINLLIGMTFCGQTRWNLSDWVAGNGLMLLIAACVWVFIACMAMFTRKSWFGSIGLLVILLILPSGLGAAAVVIPALTVLFAPAYFGLIEPRYFGGVFQIGNYFFPLIFLLGVTALFFVMAVRKYRRDDQLAAGSLFGLLIVTVFFAITIYGMQPEWRQLYFQRYGGDLRRVQCVGSIIAATILGLISVSAAAWVNEDYQRRRAVGDSALGRRPINLFVVVLVVATMAAVFPFFVLHELQLGVGDAVRIFVALATSLASIGILMRLRYRSKSSAMWVAVLWLFVTWILPWLIVLVAMGMAPRYEEKRVWTNVAPIGGFSPAGTICAVLGPDSDSLALRGDIGLTGQVVLAAGLVVLYFKFRRPRTIIFPVVGGDGSAAG